MRDSDDWRIELIAALAVGFFVVVALVSCPRGTSAQPTALIGQCPPPDSAYRVTRVERQTTSLPVDPLESLRIWLSGSPPVFLYGDVEAPLIKALLKPVFDIRLVKGKE